MNRRSFLSGMLKACVAPMFLPGAGRLWVARLRGPQWVVNPEWRVAPYEFCFWTSEVAVGIPPVDRDHTVPVIVTPSELDLSDFTLESHLPRRFKLSGGSFVEVDPFVYA